MAVKNSFVK